MDRERRRLLGVGNGEGHGGPVGWRKADLLQYFRCLPKPAIYYDGFEFPSVQQAKRHASVIADFGCDRELLRSLGHMLNSNRIVADQKHAAHRGLGPRRTHTGELLHLTLSAVSGKYLSGKVEFSIDPRENVKLAKMRFLGTLRRFARDFWLVWRLSTEIRYLRRISEISSENRNCCTGVG